MKDSGKDKAAIDVSPSGEDGRFWQNKAAVDVSPSGEDKKIQAKQSSD
jgi:hypothetical protein